MHVTFYERTDEVEGGVIGTVDVGMVLPPHIDNVRIQEILSQTKTADKRSFDPTKIEDWRGLAETYGGGSRMWVVVTGDTVQPVRTVKVRAKVRQ